MRDTTSIFHWEYLSESLTFPKFPSQVKESNGEIVGTETLDEIIEKIGL